MPEFIFLPPPPSTSSEHGSPNTNNYITKFMKEKNDIFFFFFFCIPLYYRHRVLSHMLFGWLYKLEWNLRINKILGIQYEFQSKSTQRGQTIVRYPLGPQVDAFKHTHYKATWVDQLLLLSNKIKWGKECTFLVTEILQSPQARYKRDGDMWN